jgi:phospholipid-transporting ATPase
MSQIEIKVNYVLGIILAIQVVLCLICAILYGVYRSKYEAEDVYIDWPDYSIPLDSFIEFLTYFVLLNTMIPISLVVSMEVVKMFQKYFIEKDQMMFSPYRNRYVSVQSASLNEELGQIEYVFTDKTGTLTMNVMEFKIAVIGSHLFGDLNLISNKEGDNRPRFKGFRDDGLKKLLANGSGDGGLYSEITVRNREGDDQITFKRKRELAEEYFLVLGLAHEVITETNKRGEVIYQGPSPDEIALVDAAKSMEYEFLRSSQAETFIKIRGREKKFQLLQSFPFTSDRKRMSIIIRDPRDNRIKMFTKGVTFPPLRRTPS